MRLDRSELSKAVQTALSLGAVAAVGVTGTAFAQNAAPAQNDQKQPQTLQTIVVTGSHIRRVDLETSNPVVTVSSQQIQATGKLTIGDVVQNLPVVTGGVQNPHVNNGGGSGSTVLGLRGLGPSRTLVLVDGHRVINPDLNSIPANAVERIEVLTDGASAVYGSDAIGGVINIILKSNYQGAEFQANYGISDHDDGARQGVSFTFGQTSDKGSILAGVDYNKFDSILQGNRKFSENSISVTGSPSTPPYGFVGGSSFPPRTRVALPKSMQTGAFAGCSNVALNGTGNVPATNTDPTFPNDYHCFDNQHDKYNYATVNYLMTPNERTNAFIKGVYHLSDSVDAYMTYYHNKTSSGFQLAPALLGTVYGAKISADNMYNPFGVNYNQTTGYDFRARLVPAGNRAASNSNTTDQLMIGLRGTATVFGQSWTWDVGYDYGHISTINTLLGLPNVDELNKMMGPSMLVNGVPTCVQTPGDASTAIAGCTPFDPFNLFTPQSQATLAGVSSPAINNSFSIVRTEHADISGGLFDLPAGTVQLAAGASYRKNYVNAHVDPVLILDPATGTCTLGSQCSSPLQGGYTVKEAYAEVFVPILKDLPFAHALNLTVGDRYSKYSTFGTTNNWKFALEYRPIEDLLLRGTVAEVFRAPGVADVFGAPGSSAPSLSADPCDFIAPTPTTPNPNAGNPACVGVPATGTFQNQDVLLGQQIKAINSGSAYANFPLGPETGKSFDMGFVYSPHYVPGLTVGVDYWRVYLNNVITGIGAQTSLNLCFAGVSQYCPLISRFPATSTQPGQIQQILQPTGNLGRIDVSGWDLSANYKLPQFSFGQFTVGLSSTYMNNFDIQTAPGIAGNITYHAVGQLGGVGSGLAASCPFPAGAVCLFPRWRAQGLVNWQLGAWDASWQLQYIGDFQVGSTSASDDYSYIPGIPFYVQHYGSTTYSNVSVGYNIEPINTRLQFGIDNVFDKQPPFISAARTQNANTDPNDFDTIGRYYWGRVTVKF